MSARRCAEILSEAHKTVAVERCARMFVRRFRCERDDVTVDWISALPRVASLAPRRSSLSIQHDQCAFTTSFYSIRSEITFRRRGRETPLFSLSLLRR